MGSGLSSVKSVGFTVLVIGVLTWLKRRRKAAVTDGSPERATRGAVAVTTAAVPSSTRRDIPPRPTRPAPRPQRSGPEIFICLDLEWTCDGDVEDRQVHSDDTEIIEFSYVIWDDKANRLACERQHYCKNQRTPLTRFCTDLTGITEETLASAGTLADALEGLQRDLNDEQLRGRPCCAVTHGSADLELILPMQCKALGLQMPKVLQTYSDLRLAAQRHLLQQGRISERASGLKEICESLGVEMMGKEHSGLDDSFMVLLALQQLLKHRVDLQPVNFVAEGVQFLEGALSKDSRDSRLCIDGLPFNAVATDIMPWLQQHLGEEASAELSLWIVLLADGRASGRGVMQFPTWEAACRAFKLFEGGKLISCPAIEGVRRDWERLVLIRPLREEARLPKLAAIPLEGLKAPALAPFPSSMDQLYKGPNYCFAYQKGDCWRGAACHYLHKIAPGKKPCQRKGSFRRE